LQFNNLHGIVEIQKKKKKIKMNAILVPPQSRFFPIIKGRTTVLFKCNLYRLYTKIQQPLI